MYYISLSNYNGGVNNLYTATDDKTGYSATSTISKEAAIYNLDRKLSKLGLLPRFDGKQQKAAE